MISGTAELAKQRVRAYFQSLRDQVRRTDLNQVRGYRIKSLKKVKRREFAKIVNLKKIKTNLKRKYKIACR